MIVLSAVTTSIALVGATVWWTRNVQPPRPVRHEPPPPMWESYLAEERGGPAAVLVDLAWQEHGTDPTLTQAVWVMIDMLDPGRHGVGTSDETTSVGRLEQALLETLHDTTGAQLVGRVRAQGAWRLLFMAPGSADPHPTIARVLAAAEVGSFRVLATPDPTWRAYRTCLAPDEERAQWLDNARQLRALIDLGQPVGVARTLCHELAFDDPACSEKFTELAARSGFDVADVTQAGPTVMVTVARTDVVDLDRVQQVVEELRGLAKPFDGRYAGWGCAPAH